MEQKNRILIVEDDTDINNLLYTALQKAGYETVQAFSGTEARMLFQMDKAGFSLILLDLMLPGISGEEVLAQIRKQGNTPVIVLTAKDGLDEKIGLLTSGADDYITKPFGTSELLARIRTSLRHSNRMASNSPLFIRPYKCQGLMLDFEKRMVTLDGKEIHLTPVEYKIVAYLSKNSGKVMTYASVMENVWGPFTDNNNRILRVNMANIRRKIERNPSQPQFLFTEVGVGYRMCEDENEM